MADAPRYISDLPKSLKDILTTLGENKNTNPEEFVRAIKSYGYDEQTAERLGQDANRAYKPIPPLTQETPPPQQTQFTLSGGGSILGSIVGATGSLATRDWSGPNEITNDINRSALDTQMEELFGENGSLKDALARGDDKAIQEKLDLIDPNKLLDNQFSELHDRLQKAGADEATMKELEDQHTLLRPETEKRKPESKRDKQWRERREKAFKERLDSVDRSNKSEEEKLKEKQRLLREHAQLQLREKLGKNNKHFDGLLAKRFLGIGGHSKLPDKVKKEILKNIKIDREARWRQLAAQRKIEKNLQKQQRFTTGPKSFLRPEAIKISFPELTPTPTAPSSTSGRSTPRLRVPGLSGGRKAAAKAFFSQPEVLAAIIGISLLVLLFILVIVIVIMVANSGKDFTRYNAIPLQCATKGEIDPLADPLKVEAKTKNDFSIDVVGSPDQQDAPAVLAVQKTFYDTVCKLFGNVEGAQYQAQRFNTFGQLVVGTLNQRYNTNHVIRFQYNISLVDSTGCSIEMDSFPNKWWINYNPTTCTTEHLEFLVAQSLGHDLILQQQNIEKYPQEKSNNIFSLFTSSPEIQQDGLLPTSSCQTGRDYGEGAGDQQQRNCFADMVGAYLTYPFYFDATTNAAITTFPTPSPATTLPISPTPINSPSPTTLPFSSPLLDFPLGGYKDYYNFAKTNLFDGLELFLSNSDIVDNAKFITSKLLRSDASPYDGGFYDRFDLNKIKDHLPHVTYTTANGYIVAARPDESTYGIYDVRYWCTHLIVDAFAMANIKDLADNEEKDGLTAVVNMRKFFIDNPNGNLQFIPYYNHPVSVFGENQYLQNLLLVEPGDAMFEEDSSDFTSSGRDVSGGEHHVVLIEKINWANRQTGDGTIYYYESNNNGDVYSHRAISGWKINDSWEIIGFGASKVAPSQTTSTLPSTAVNQRGIN